MSPTDWHLRVIEQLDEALTHAPLLDRCAALAHAEFSDEPFPRGSNETFLTTRWEQKETLLLLGEAPSPDEPRPAGICLVGGLEDPLLRWRTPLILLLDVAPAHRHRGLARRMVAEVRRIMHGRGIPRVAGRVGHNDDALISMGERWGFVRHWELMLHE